MLPKVIMEIIEPITFSSPFEIAQIVTSEEMLDAKEKLKLDVSMIIGRVSIASAGFKIDREVRKPIYMVLELGSIVFAND